MDVSGEPLLLKRWRAWKGAVDCALCERVFAADELRSIADSIAGQLGYSGLRAGEPVILILANTAAFPVLLMALLQERCNPILTHAATPAPEVRRLAGAFGARFIVHDFVEGLSTLDPGVGATIARLPVGPMNVSLFELATNGEPTLSVPGGGVVLHPTSGTSGAAKFCVRNQEAAVAEAENYTSRIDVYREARVTVTTPLTHAFAYGFGLASALVTDSTLAVSPIFNPKRILRLERETPSDILALVPPMVRTLADMGATEEDRSMAGAVFYAGAILDRPTAAAFEETFEVRIDSILGTTETGAISTTWSPGERIEGVGRALDGVTASVVDTDRYAGLGSGVGELTIESISMMQGYLTGDGLRGADAFRTGDIVSIGQGGAIRIVGRARDIINLGGMKVDPAEVEAVILADPAVADAAVYPGIRDDGAEFVQAAISGADADAASVRKRCLSELAAHKVPVQIHLVETIPRTPSGKILKIKCPGYPPSLIAGGAGG